MGAVKMAALALNTLVLCLWGLLPAAGAAHAGVLSDCTSWPPLAAHTHDNTGSTPL